MNIRQPVSGRVLIAHVQPLSEEAVRLKKDFTEKSKLTRVLKNASVVSRYSMG